MQSMGCAHTIIVCISVQWLEFSIVLESLVLLINWAVAILGSSENEFSMMFVKWILIIFAASFKTFGEILSGSFSFLESA